MPCFLDFFRKRYKRKSTPNGLPRAVFSDRDFLDSVSIPACKLPGTKSLGTVRTSEHNCSAVHNKPSGEPDNSCLGNNSLYYSSDSDEEDYEDDADWANRLEVEFLDESEAAEQELARLIKKHNLTVPFCEGIFTENLNRNTASGNILLEFFKQAASMTTITNALKSSHSHLDWANPSQILHTHHTDTVYLELCDHSWCVPSVCRRIARLRILITEMYPALLCSILGFLDIESIAMAGRREVESQARHAKSVAAMSYFDEIRNITCKWADVHSEVDFTQLSELDEDIMADKERLTRLLRAFKTIVLMRNERERVGKPVIINRITSSL